MPVNYIPNTYGYAILAKTQGLTGGSYLAAATQVVVPYARVVPFNIFGNAYPAVVNFAGYPSVSYIGKKRPGYTITAFMKQSWATSLLFNDLLFSPDPSNATAPNATTRFSCKFYNTVQSRVWDWSRCTHIQLQASASGGPVVVTMGFVSRWGETECPYGTTLPDGEVVPAAITFNTPSGPDAGQLASIIDYDWRSDSLAGTASGGTHTARYCRGFALNLLRGQGPVDYIDGTRYAKDVASGQFSGSLALDLNPNSDVIPSTAATLRMYTNAGAAPRFKVSLLLNQDSFDQPEDVGISNATENYTLIDSSTAGNPATCATY